jgi:signal transduction histidine kinase/ActR/RegA family two-component response regulator
MMLRRPQSIWVRYGVAIASFVVALVVRWLLSYFYGGIYPFAPIFLAVIFSAWYGGFGPPIFVAILGLVVGYLTANSRTAAGHPVLRLMLYAFTSGGIALVGGAMARARERIAEQMDTLRRQHEELVLADHRKDEFIAVLAHELRNPLAPIASALDILNHPGVDGATALHAREVAERQLWHMTRLVDDLLDVSRIMRGKIELRKEPVELAAVVERAVETGRPLIDSGHHALSVRMPEEPLWLDGDLVRLAQALGNLLCNAAKYTEAGGRIELCAGRENGEAVISVRDTGIGIAAEMLPRLFQMFMQVAPGAHRSQGGLGIGLTLARNLINIHGGTIEARSEGVGKGSEFVVRLPVAKAPAAAEVADGDPSLALRVGVPDGRRILIVDDNADAAQSLATLLKLRGHEVRVAFGGAQALRMIDEASPEWIFLDIGMPDVDGYEVARRLRGRGECDFVLVALTGWGTEQDRQRTREAGFDHHLTKPVDLAAVEAVLASERMTNDQAPMTNEVRSTVTA